MPNSSASYKSGAFKTAGDQWVPVVVAESPVSLFTTIRVTVWLGSPEADKGHALTLASEKAFLCASASVTSNIS